MKTALIAAALIVGVCSSAEAVDINLVVGIDQLQRMERWLSATGGDRLADMMSTPSEMQATQQRHEAAVGFGFASAARDEAEERSQNPQTGPATQFDMENYWHPAENYMIGADSAMALSDGYFAAQDWGNAAYYAWIAEYYTWEAEGLYQEFCR